MRELDIALIFPMDDTASARLMIVKAECLHSAGVISAAEKRTILDRAAAIIEESMHRTPPDLCHRRCASPTKAGGTPLHLFRRAGRVLSRTRPATKGRG
jgi:hypothetical protein